MKKDVDLARRIRGDNQRDFRNEVTRVMSPSESQLNETVKLSKIKSQIMPPK
jgi:hypothetical protein